MTNDSTRNLIISALGNNFPLSLKQIHVEIKKHKNVSYQAVHKVVFELVKEGVVDKIEKQYFLNKDWIKKQTNDFSKYFSKYFNIKYNSNQLDENTKIEVFRFNSVKELLDFIVTAYVKNHFNNDGKIFVSVRRLLPFIPPSWVHFIKKLLKENQVFVVCKENSATDKWVSKIYKSLGIKIKTGMNISHYNSICIGDYVLQYFFFFSDSYRKKLYSFSDKLDESKSPKLLKLTSDIIYKKTDIYLIVNKHSVLVNDIKQSIAKEF